MSHARRKALIEPDHPRLSIVRQCELLSVNRSSYYYQPTGENAQSLELMRLIDEQYLETPCMVLARWPGICVVMAMA